MRETYENRFKTYAEFGLTIGLDLIGLSQKIFTDSKIVYALGVRIVQCNSRENLWQAQEIYSFETGEIFDGLGRYWQCGSRLCPYCAAANSRRNRKRIQTAIANYKQPIGESYRLITLTMPKLGLPLEQTRKILSRAWTLFRKRRWFKEKIPAGSKAEEFTVDKQGRVHLHLHLLASSRYFKDIDLKMEWSRVLEIAFHEAGIDLDEYLGGKYAVVNLKRIWDVKKAIFEVTKYITKSSSFKFFNEAELIAFAKIPRFARSFELFGKWQGRHEMASENHGQTTYLDNTDIKDGRKSENDAAERTERQTWRQKVPYQTHEEILISTRRQFEAARRFREAQFRRRWPDVELMPFA